MMRVTLFGTRGSIPAPGPETARYGGNTPSVEVRGKNGGVLVLDAGTGIRRLGAQVSLATARIDIPDEEYEQCLGWGHSTYRHAFEFASQVGAKELVPFHHDPSHNDEMLDPCLSG